MALPEENLDNKTFGELVNEAVSRIPVYAPEWTDHNVHDPGITFIELFAWLTEIQIYRLNKITDRSKRKFLKLVGISSLEPAKAAGVDVTFALKNEPSIDIPAGTLLAAPEQVSGKDLVFTTENAMYAVKSQLKKIYSNPVWGKYIDNTDANWNENVHYYAFCDAEYLFSWDDIPASASGNIPRLLKDFLKLNFNAVWVDTANIQKSDNLRTVTISTASDLLSIELDDVPSNATKATVKAGIKTNELIVRKENGKLNIYVNVCGPKKGKEFYLGFDESLTINESSEMIPLTFYLYEEDLSKTGRYCRGEPDLSTAVKLSWKYYTEGTWNDEQDTGWKDIEMIRDETNNLTVSGRIWIRITGTMGMKNEITDDQHENLFWLRCRVEEAGYESPPKIDCILLNTVSAKQCTDLKEMRFSGNGLPDFRIDLKNVHVLDGTLEVHINELWKKVEDFDASKPGYDHYTVEYIAEQTTTRLTFGDGINGKIPPEGDNNIIVRYRSGGGAHGNVKPGTITRVLDEQLAEKVTVHNTKAASGGQDAEILDGAIQRARRELKEITRAVTSDDYEKLATNTPGLRVARAKAIPGYHPLHRDNEVPGVVTVIVVPMSPYDKAKPSGGFLSTVYAHLDKRRMLTTELFVIGPEYIEISVTANVKIKPQYDGGNIKNKVSAKLRGFLDSISGGVDGKGWQFGRSVYASEIYEIIDSVEGIEFVETATLKGKRNNIEIFPDRNGDIKIPRHELACSGDHKVVPVE